MITQNDFAKKQIIFVFCNDGERINLLNENLVIKDKEGNIKLQCSCYRLFLVYVIGPCSLTTPIIQKATKFGFFIALMTSGFHLYNIIGAPKDGNTLLKKKQYTTDGTEIAKIITKNKIHSQMAVLKKVRDKSDSVKEAILMLDAYQDKIDSVDSIAQLMAYEGLASKVYFRNHFNNVEWHGRQPRVKRDYINSVLDIGYTILFSYIDAILCSYGFDTYCGVLHTQFYMRKSLTCDIVEPFRFIIDRAVKKAINLKQIDPNDFTEIRGQYQLQWKYNSKYVRFLILAVNEYKNDIFGYIQQYYRAFMKGLPPSEFPFYKEGNS